MPNQVYKECLITFVIGEKQELPKDKADAFVKRVIDTMSHASITDVHFGNYAYLRRAPNGYVPNGRGWYMYSLCDATAIRKLFVALNDSAHITHCQIQIRDESTDKYAKVELGKRGDFDHGR